MAPRAAGPDGVRTPSSASASPPSGRSTWAASPASLLAAGGRIEELSPGRLAVADALLTTRPAPRSGTGF